MADDYDDGGWGACLWPEEILGTGPYQYLVGVGPLDPGVGAWFGPGGCVGDPDAMTRRAHQVLAAFEAGVCPNCGQRLAVSSPGWVRCPTSYATGPRSDRSDPIEYRIVTDPADGRPRRASPARADRRGRGPAPARHRGPPLGEPADRRVADAAGPAVRCRR